MDDEAIIDLYFARSEEALKETKNKYHAYLTAIAINILHNDEDCEECVSDAYFSAWRRIPPDRPGSFSAYLGKLVRCASIDLYRKHKAQKRYGELTILLSELAECVPDLPEPAQAAEAGESIDAINCWLRSLNAEKRVLFVRRYWYGDPLHSLAAAFGMSQSRLASLMWRLRGDLRDHLEKEGILP